MGKAALVLRALAAGLTDEHARKRAGWVIVILLSPVLVVLAVLCSLGSGTSSHNVSVVELCFDGGAIPDNLPEGYGEYILDMRASFDLLDSAIRSVDSKIEAGGLDDVRVKALFYALYFGEEGPGRRDHRQFVDCFVDYETRTATVVKTDDGGNETEFEEVWQAAIPVEDWDEVCRRIRVSMGVVLTEDQLANADSIYNLIKYGYTEQMAEAQKLAGEHRGQAAPGRDAPDRGGDR